MPASQANAQAEDNGSRCPRCPAPVVLWASTQCGATIYPVWPCDTHSKGTVKIPVTTTLTIEGHRIKEYKGIVRGIIVRSPTIAQGILGGLKSIIGGRIGAYTEMCEQARQQAYELMIQHAREVGANAVVGLHYDASEVVGKESATEVLCYGTAVVIEPVRD